MTKVVATDNANSGIKTKTSSSEGFIEHAITRITEQQYSRIELEADGNMPDGYMNIANEYFVVGDAAKSFKMSLREGPARYTSDYYGVMFAAAMLKAYQTDNVGDIVVYAAYPPGHIDYIDDIKNSLYGAQEGNWSICYGEDRCMNYRIVDVKCVPESAGGVFNRVLTADGKKYYDEKIVKGRTVAIDIGHLTTDFMGFNGTKADFAVRVSETIGIGDAITKFKASIRRRHSRIMKNAVDIHPDIITNGLRTGMIEISGYELDCHADQEEALNQLVNRISDAYKLIAGGGVNYNTVLLTGGGAYILGLDRIRELLGHGNVVLAEETPEKLRMANVYGIYKMHLHQKYREELRNGS